MSTDVVYLRRSLVSLSRLIITVPLCDDPNTSTVCECTGLLAFTAGRWQHVEACIDCFDSTEPCPHIRPHAACIDPNPLLCAHDTCREPVDLVIECAAGREPRVCCGCCWVRADMLEGRRTWPNQPILG